MAVVAGAAPAGGVAGVGKCALRGGSSQRHRRGRIAQVAAATTHHDITHADRAGADGGRSGVGVGT